MAAVNYLLDAGIQWGAAPIVKVLVLCLILSLCFRDLFS